MSLVSEGVNPARLPYISNPANWPRKPKTKSGSAVAYYWLVSSRSHAYANDLFPSSCTSLYETLLEQCETQESRWKSS